VGITGGGLALTTCLAGDPFGLTQFLVYNQTGGWWLWDLGMLALFLLFGGIFTFDIDAVKRQLLSRWSFIPIMAGALIPLRILAGYLQEATTEGFNRWRVDMNMINILTLIITSLGLIALGYLLEEYAAAWSSGDPQKAAAFYAPEAVHNGSCQPHRAFRLFAF